MKKIALSSALLLTALLPAGCSHSENDGRKYYSGSSPIQGKMGVSFRRVETDAPPVTETEGAAGEAAASTGFDEPPGLLDRNDKPDEPGSEYWMHGQLSPNPIQGKMGVRVERRKK